MQVIILGMHRSGTSMLAGICSKLGVMMGQNLIMGDTPQQPTGYYEDQEFVDLNGQILREAGGGWEKPPSLEAIKKAGKDKAELIKEIISKRDKAYPIWGWKDPRTCLTLKCYLPYLNNPKIIVILRDKDAIISSLVKRETDKKGRRRVSYEQALSLVNAYQDAILRSNTSYMVVHYEDLIRTKDVRPIARYLGLPDDWKQTNRARNHIMPSLNREGQTLG